MSNLAIVKRATLEKIYPSGAASTNATSGLNGAYGAWQQLVSAANMTSEFLACGIYISWAALISGATLNQGYHMQIQLGTGAAGAEVVIAQRSLAHGAAFTVGTGGTGQMRFGTVRLLRFAPRIIPTGTRIAYRATQVDNTVAHNLSAYVIGYEPANIGMPIERLLDRHDAYRRGMTTVQSNCYPAAAETIVSGAGTAFTYGTVVEFIAAAANDMLITSITANLPAVILNLKGFIQIGIGAAGSEEWVAMVGLPSAAATFGYTGDLELLNPVYVKAGERVALRAACSSTTNKDISCVIDVDELK